MAQAGTAVQQRQKPSNPVPDTATNVKSSGRYELTVDYSGRLSGKQKAAVLLICLGTEGAAEVFKRLSDDEVERLALEIANLERVAPEVRDEVLDEFLELAAAHEFMSQGGVDYARRLLEQALGHQRAVDVMTKLTSVMQVRPFDLMRNMEPDQVLNFLQGEHPQTVALILAYLHPHQSSTILSELPADRQADIAKRIATMDRTAPDLLREVETLLEQKFSSVLALESTSAGGVETVVGILNSVDRGTEKQILEELEQTDPELAEEIRKRMFVFEDIVWLDDRSLQRVLREVDLNDDLPLALKVVSDEVRRKVFANISKRAAETLQENIDYLGPVRLRMVEEAQQKIVSVVRRLDEQGEIVVARGTGDQVVV